MKRFLNCTNIKEFTLHCIRMQQNIPPTHKAELVRLKSLFSISVLFQANTCDVKCWPWCTVSCSDTTTHLAAALPHLQQRQHSTGRRQTMCALVVVSCTTAIISYGYNTAHCFYDLSKEILCISRPSNSYF